MQDEKAVSAVAVLKAAIVYYASLGVKVARVMTNNGSAYRSFAFARACRRLKIKHLRTKPYTPKIRSNPRISRLGLSEDNLLRLHS